MSDKETARLLTACGCSRVIETEIAQCIIVPYRRGYGIVDTAAMWPTDHSFEGRMAHDRKVFGPVHRREFKLEGRDPEDRDRWLYREVVE